MSCARSRVQWPYNAPRPLRALARLEWAEPHVLASCSSCPRAPGKSRQVSAPAAAYSPNSMPLLCAMSMSGAMPCGKRVLSAVISPVLPRVPFDPNARDLVDGPFHSPKVLVLSDSRC